MAQCGAYTKGGDHCCWLMGVECPFLERNVDGHPYSCQIRRECGSWEEAHKDHRYTTIVKPVLEKIVGDTDCGDWPRPGEKCATCGAEG